MAKIPCSKRRAAFLHNALAAFLVSVAVMALLIGLLIWNSGDDSSALTVYCAAGLRGPVQTLAHEFEKEHGIKIRLQLAGSQTLLASIDVVRRGDLFLPADDWYIDKARERNLIDEVVPLLELTPVVAVAKGNPKQIGSLQQLTMSSCRLALANPDAAAVGRLTRAALSGPLWGRLRKNATAMHLTVSDVANDVRLGHADAGIVWDATIFQYPKLEAVPVPELSRCKAQVGVAVLRCSEQPQAALDFARFLADPDRGLAEFKRCGFQPIPTGKR